MKRTLDNSNSESFAELTADEINAVAELFRSAAMESKRFETSLRTAKDKLLAYAKQHPELFQGCSLGFKNGVTVTRSERVRSSLNQDAVSLAWLDKMLLTPSADAVSIAIDHRKLKMGDVKALALLDEVDYSESRSFVWSVTATSVSRV